MSLDFLKGKGPILRNRKGINNDFIVKVIDRIRAAEENTKASSAAKHQSVVDYILDQYHDEAVEFLNDLIDIPKMPESVEKKLIELTLNLLIKVLVWALNTFVWKVE